MTVVSRKLEQSAERTLKGSRPSRVPVTARLQLLPAQARSTRTLPKANETKERTATTEAFILTVCFSIIDNEGKLSGIALGFGGFC